MGAFDKEVQLKNAPFANGEFVLWGGEYQGIASSAEYGDNPKATVTAGTDESDPKNSETFIVFGVMAEQINRQSDGDFPAVVKLGQDGRANVIQLVRKLDLPF